ncbi:hypothetical protein B0H16DRAFT_1546960 [Mycena metata]|uniref:HD domain-containing protein n=1 Tax=Mycena metata TaxID=1033252 RepID=A0AAD7N925_9AGAR|nr:hypothetical protein B0H16DRAFT_1546960 [Mycena metata]
MSTGDRLFKDSAFDYIRLSPLLSDVMDTPQFQRLRYVKQMGTAYFIWPGAAHNRFEHSLGVAHLAGLMVENIRVHQPELGITDRDVECVKMAGHVWDNHFVPSGLPQLQWTHEEQSEIMLDELVREKSVKISREDLDFHTKDRKPAEKPYLFQIVANKLNGMDVDKWEYIARDSAAIGDLGNQAALRLVNSARVIGNEICYHIKDALTVYNLFQARFSIHSIYNHKTAKAIEFMLVDAWKAADPVMNYADRMSDPAKYLYLTDDIVQEIERSTDPRLASARAILYRLRVRDLYVLAGKTHLPWEHRKLVKERITPDAVVQAAATLSELSHEDRTLVTELTQDLVMVDIVPIHWGMKDRNPFEFIKFYDGKDVNAAFHLAPGDATLLFPAVFGEVLVRAFTRDNRCVLFATFHISSVTLVSQLPTCRRVRFCADGERLSSFHYCQTIVEKRTGRM